MPRLTSAVWSHARLAAFGQPDLEIQTSLQGFLVLRGRTEDLTGQPPRLPLGVPPGNLQHQRFVFIDLSITSVQGSGCQLIKLSVRRRPSSPPSSGNRKRKLYKLGRITTLQEVLSVCKMNPTTISNAPVFGGAYVPYLYQSGLFQLYLQPPGHVPQTAAEPAYAVYDFSSDLVQPRRHFHPQTVEQIVERGYFKVPRDDPITAMISDKKHTSWLGLDDLISQIRNRYELYQRNVYEVELAKCSSLNAIFGLESERGGFPADSRERYSLSKNLQKLYQEQREERLSLWQDVSKLRLSIAELAQQYLASYRKAYFMAAAEGEKQ